MDKIYHSTSRTNRMSTEEFRNEYKTNIENMWEFGRPLQGFSQSTDHSNPNIGTVTRLIVFGCQCINKDY